MRKKKCRNPECCQWFVPVRAFQNGCCPECDFQIAMAAVRKKRVIKAAQMKRERIAQAKAERAELRSRKKALRSRTTWYGLLQEEVNTYVRLRDWDKPCCTCGDHNPSHKFDAGHYLTAGGHPDLRFELTNIHKQCVNCNQYNGGRPDEYRDFMIRTYGEEHLRWLKGPHPTLREQFPTTQSIEDEIRRYRALNRKLKSAINNSMAA
jgi:hypothetical protein